MNTEKVVMFDQYRRVRAMPESHGCIVEMEPKGLGLAQDDNQWQNIADAFSKGFSSIVQTRFNEWDLTAAEKEIALLILRGKTFGEIASIRNTKIRTARCQATFIYEKSGMSNRAQLTGYFLNLVLGG